MIAEDVMNADVVTAEETVSILTAHQILEELEVRHLPIVRGIELVGMVSDRDLRSIGLKAVTDLENVEEHRAMLDRPVSTITSGGAVGVEASDDVSEVIDLMLEENVGAIPVVDVGTQDLVGLISYVDLLQALRDVLD